MLKQLTAASILALTATAATAADGPLVTTDWLEENLDNPQVALIEVSVNPGVFERGHIPGATNFVWHTDLVDPVRRDIASREQLEGLLRAAGVNEDSTVVLYGDTNNWVAAWGAWVLDSYGVADVRLLDVLLGELEDDESPPGMAFHHQRRVAAAGYHPNGVCQRAAS